MRNTTVIVNTNAPASIVPTSIADITRVQIIATNRLLLHSTML